MLLSLLLAALDDAATSQARTAQQNEVRARLGISRERPLVGLRGRLAWVFEAFSERVGMFTFSIACSEPNVRGNWGYHLRSGPKDVETELSEIGRPLASGAIKSVFLEVLHGKGPAGNMLEHTPERTRLDPFIPWLARQIKWIDEENPPVLRFPKSRLFRDLGGTMTLKPAHLSGYLVYVKAFHSSIIETQSAYHAYASSPIESRTKAYLDYEAALQARCDRMVAIYRENGLESISTDIGNGLYPPNPGSLVETWSGKKEMNYTAQDLLREVHLLRLVEHLPLLLDWATAGNEARLETLHYPEAAALAKAWHREIEAREAAARKAAAPVVPLGGTLLVALPSGAGIYELGPSDLSAESEAMHHCVGRSSIYRTGIERGNTRIFSIRNANGSPEFTLEATPLKTRDGRRAPWIVVQWKGSGNRIPGLSESDTGKIPYGVKERGAWITRFPNRILWDDIRLVSEAVTALASIRIAYKTRDLDLVVQSMGKTQEG